MTTLADYSIPRDLLRQMYTAPIPRSETYGRIYTGRTIDLDRIESAIRQAERGVMPLITDLSRESKDNDPKFSGAVNKRVRAYATADVSFTPGKSESPAEEAEAKRIAAAVEQAWLKIRGLRRSRFQSAYAVFDGRSALEIDWEHRVSTGRGSGPLAWVPRSLGWIHPARLTFGAAERKMHVVERWTASGFYSAYSTPLEDIPGKFIRCTPSLFCEYPEREGLAPRALYWLFFKRFSWRYRMILTEMFGIPWRIVKHSDDLVSDNPDSNLEAVEQAERLGGEGVAKMPRGLDLEVVSPDGTSSEMFHVTSDDVDQQLQVLALGQSATTESDANRASGVVAKSEQELILEGDAVEHDEAWQEQLIDVMVALNFGKDALYLAPKLETRVKPPRDRGTELERVKLVVSLGVPVALAEVYDIAGLRTPTKDEATINKIEQVDALTGKPVSDQVAKVLPPGAGDDDGGGPEGGGGTDDDLVAQVMKALGTDLDEDPDTGEDDALGKLAASRTAGGLELAKQPETVNGSPEGIIERALREGVRFSSAWASELAAAVDGLDSGTAIHSAIAKAGAGVDLERMSKTLERGMVRGLMLGALDAHWEAEFHDTIQPAAFAAGRTLELAGGVPGFVAKPFQEAISSFLGRKVVTRRIFDRMLANAKRRAFTVAGLARKEMVAVAHDELGKAIAAGSDLRTFGKQLAGRFETAGWVASNPSHVETVFRNGVMRSYSVGRDEQMTQPHVLAARPYWQIQGVKDDRARATHAAAHGKVLVATDAFWKRAPLPFGHNCRCRKVSRSAADLKRLGLSVTSGAALTGLPDEGWDSDGD